MSSSKPEVLEAYSRYIGTAELFINTDASWSIGPNTKSLVPVHFGDIAKINDDTFGFSAVAVESSGTGYTLYVRSDADGATIVQVKIDAAGAVDAASITVLGADQLYGAENSTGFHAPGEAARILAESINLAREGQLAVRDPAYQPSFVNAATR